MIECRTLNYSNCEETKLKINHDAKINYSRYRWSFYRSNFLLKHQIKVDPLNFVSFIKVFEGFFSI